MPIQTCGVDRSIRGGGEALEEGDGLVGRLVVDFCQEGRVVTLTHDKQEGFEAVVSANLPHK